jgi:hypothetical protein
MITVLWSCYWMVEVVVVVVWMLENQSMTMLCTIKQIEEGLRRCRKGEG